ncbi:MAG: HNH endonuclease [Candidatus Sumerlaeota bacterium]|nr:HNH endonuclease [Candidatus Sumerlaeota bacterium]
MSSKISKSWSRDNLILAMNLYCRIPFGRQHSRSPEVIELARALGRTPGSVAMKLNNFSSLDPEESSRGIQGLKGTSKLDRQIWEEFNANWEKMAIESEDLWKKIVVVQNLKYSPQKSVIRSNKLSSKRQNEIIPPKSEYIGPTDEERLIHARLAQDFFRRTVLSAYGVRCCITGNPVPQLLIACHILPWSKYPEHRMNPRNGLCLSRLHDAAFDQGLIAFDEQYRLALSHDLKEYLPNDSLHRNFEIYEGRTINLPEKFNPNPEFLKYHRDNIFRG